MKGFGKKQNAFTIIELLVVTSIIFLLVALTFITLSGYRDKARNINLETVLSQTRNVSAYVHENSNGYIALCNQGDHTIEESNPDYPGLKTIEEESHKLKGKNPSCYSSQNEYCVEAGLIGAGYFCVDSNGVAKENSGSVCAAANMRCQ